MIYSREVIARYALGVATPDEQFWGTLLFNSGRCVDDVVNLRTLGQLPKTEQCYSELDLIRIADKNDMFSTVMALDDRHIFNCERCGRLGHYIANMMTPVYKAPVAMVG